LIDGVGAKAKSVAVMQPYFYPYPAYFALLAAVDTFVIYDCVQFPRRGRVHRTELGRSEKGPEWLTLPLARQPREILIRDLRFASGATQEFHRRIEQSPLRRVVERLPSSILDELMSELTDVGAYLEANLRAVASLCGLTPRILRSSDLAVNPALRGQERVIAIARTVGADLYVNASGGRHLYDAERFAAEGLQLQFLPPYEGRHRFLLPALAESDPAQLRAEVLLIAGQCRNG
jgi:hypothetical protein